MASLNSTNINISNCTPISQISSLHVLFYLVLSLQILISLTGIIGNIILCYCLFKTSFWPYYQKGLFLNVTIAALITSIIHCIQGLFQLIKFSITGEGDLGQSEWSDVAGDSAHVAVALGLAVLAFLNLYLLYKCNKYSSYIIYQNNRKVIIISIIIFLIWVLAFGFMLIGLNPHSEADEDENDIMVIISYTIHLSIQIGVAVSIWITRKVSNRLEIDFAIRGAQHSLTIRTHLKGTIHVTKAITKILIVHVITWVASFTAVFVIKESNIFDQDPSCPQDDVDMENRMAAYTGLVDCIALIFEAVLPMVLAWKQPQLSGVIRKGIWCCGDGKGTVGPSPQVGPALWQGEGGKHLNAVNEYWQMVEKDKERSKVYTGKK